MNTRTAELTQASIDRRLRFATAIHSTAEDLEASVMDAWRTARRNGSPSQCEEPSAAEFAARDAELDAMRDAVRSAVMPLLSQFIARRN